MQNIYTDYTVVFLENVVFQIPLEAVVLGLQNCGENVKEKNAILLDWHVCKNDKNYFYKMLLISNHPSIIINYNNCSTSLVLSATTGMA